MRTKTLHVPVVVLAILVFALPALAQQQKGDVELGINGSVTVPHSDPSTTTGEISGSLGKYISNNNEVGGAAIVFIEKDAQLVYLNPFFTHLIKTKNPKFYPFVGGNFGFILSHDGGTNTEYGGAGYAGIKYYLSQKFAFQLAYNFQYQHIAGASFQEQTFSVVTFGFTYLFGKHKR